MTDNSKSNPTNKKHLCLWCKTFTLEPSSFCSYDHMVKYATDGSK